MIRAFVLGFNEGLGNLGLTYDDDPNSPISQSYDYGRGLRRWLHMRELVKDEEEASGE